MSDDLDWPYRTAEIPAGGLRLKREATDVERRSLVESLGLLALPHLVSDFKIEAIAGDAYRLTGKLLADLTQACIVTLEPVHSRIDAAFDVEFWPNLGAPDDSEDASVLAGPDVEVIEHGLIPVGRIVFETLSASLDPYPRRPDAAFEWVDPRAEKPETSSPFAVLSKLKNEE